VQHTTACPAQWMARDEDDRLIYVRYRWGHLTVERFDPECDWEWERVERIYDLQVGHPLDGWMTTEEMVTLTGLEETL